jgi:carbohydrate diacid regulator
MQEIQLTAVQEYTDMLLGRLNKELLNTLETFLQKDLNVADAARALFVHRNTLIYRLDRIRELTDCDPRSFEESVNLFWALWLKKHL